MHRHTSQNAEPWVWLSKATLTPSKGSPPPQPAKAQGALTEAAGLCSIRHLLWGFSLTLVGPHSPPALETVAFPQDAVSRENGGSICRVYPPPTARGVGRIRSKELIGEPPVWRQGHGTGGGDRGCSSFLAPDEPVSLKPSPVSGFLACQLRSFLR